MNETTPPTAESDLPLPIVDRTVPPPAGPGRLRRILRAIRFVPLIWLLVATGGVIGVYFQPPGLQKLMGFLKLTPGDGTRTPFAVPPAPATKAPSAVPQAVVGLARLVPEGDVRTVAPPFGASDARIAILHVKEGDEVAAGSLLATLDSEPQLRAAVEAAQATLAVREAALAQTRASVASSRDEARAALASAESAAANARSELDRAEALRTRGFVSDSVFEQRKTASDQAKREVDRARAALSRLEAVSPDQQTDVALAARNVESARADLERARRDVARAEVRAPIDGTVLTIHVRAGEKPGAKGILNLGNLDVMTAEAEIYQTQIGRISAGDPATVTADALSQPLHGTVSRVGLEVGRQTLTDSSPAANTDARVVKVYIRLDPDSAAIARRFTNLQVVARIEPAGAR